MMTKASVDLSADASLEGIFSEIGGFGLFHVYTYLMIFIPNIIAAATYVNYMISATTLDYRCKVPECDVGENNREIAYNSTWSKYAIPTLNGKFEKCFRYAPTNPITHESGQCTADMFDNSTKIGCTEFIYASDEKNIQTEFNIHCSDSYKLALVGTVNSFGRFIFLPLSGLLSDKFGRLTMVVIGLVSSSIFGIIKSFSIDYSMYLVLEFLESAAGTCTYGGIFVLAIEMVSSRHRVLASTIISLSHPVGEIIFGFVVMYIHDFRLFIRLFYTPGVFLFVYYWILPESVRWLLVTGRIERAIKILKRIARVNGRELSQKSIEMLQLKYATELLLKTAQTDSERSVNQRSVFQSFCMIFKSKKLSTRLFVCCFQWITCCFCYYGLNLTSTLIPGANRYVGFIFVVTAEIPSVLISLPLLNRVKRRTLLFATYFLAAISIVATALVPEVHSTIILIFFMIGKASMTFAFTLIYIFTAEQWPTNIRSTIMNTCSMIGRTGSMVAPLAVILGTDYGSLPALLFGGTAIIAAISVSLTPETFSKKLPDTIEEAKCL